MFNCQSLIYHPVKQEAITPIQPNLLVKWDVGDFPRIVTQQTAQQQVPDRWQTIPLLVLLPNLDRFAIANNGTNQSYIDFYNWTDLNLVDSIAVPHSDYQEIDDNDPFCTHQRTTTLSHLSITSCGTYLVVLEQYGDIHLLDLNRKTWTCLKRRLLADYSEMVTFDRTMQFMAMEFLDMDRCYEFYRIDSLTTDRMTYLGRFWGNGRCHRGQLLFNVLANAIVQTSDRCEINYYTFNADELRGIAMATDNPLNATTPYLTKRWTLSLPYIQHPHSVNQPWRSSMVFQDVDRLIFGAGQAIVQIDTLEGNLIGEYRTTAIVNEIAFDATNQRIIAATRTGVIIAPLTEFDLEMAYLRSIQVAPTIKKIPDSSTPADLPQGSTKFIFSTIFFLIISIGCLGMILGPFFLLAIFTFGDNPFPEAVVDRSYPLGENRISEKVYPTGINWPDQKYEHIYTLEHKHGSIEVDRFTNEERQGSSSKTKPKMVGEWLVIFSTSRTLLWKSGSKPIEFYPYQIQGWDDYIIRNLNHYSSYHAKDFSVEGNRWIFEYECENLPCPQMQNNQTPPTNIRFFSDDFGKTFQIFNDIDKSKILKKRYHRNRQGD